jgi:periplasmic protein TonB
MTARALPAARQSTMNPSAEPNRSAAPRARRHRRLPATGLPVIGEDRRGWGLLSTLLHVLLILLLVTPLATHEGVVIERPQGAGGLGPAGGGGGGRRGTGGEREAVNYVKVAPAPAPAAPPVVVPAPVVKATPPPVVPPPQMIKPPEQPAEVKADIKPEAAKIEAVSPVQGTGGGTGRDGTNGNGPGSGGGIGSGIGPGRGSATGPGTGGGLQANYPPSPTDVFIPPLPMPDKVRGFHLVAEYDIDSTGKVVGFTFTPTRDGGYNKRLEEVLKSFKFRPGTKPDGTPIRMKTQIIYEF